MTNEEYKVYYDKYKNLIYKMAIKMNVGPTCLRDDLVQCGKIGLITAIERFNPEGGSTLTSYVNIWVKKEMTDFLGNNLTTIRRPMHLANTDDTIIPTISTSSIVGENEIVEDRIGGDVNGPDESLTDDEQLKINIINATKLKLKPATQEVLRLRLEENLGWREIGEKLGITHQLAYDKYAAGIKKLQIAIGAPTKPNKTK